ncbi:MAG: hypothetical protein SA339_03110 [Methanomassiliicoccus sp.]|nr:hypothetical protein [Methanomassiliicoccus sp.]
MIEKGRDNRLQAQESYRRAAFQAERLGDLAAMARSRRAWDGSWALAQRRG